MQINLTYPDEFLVGVSGWWGDLQETRDVIRSLTFHTNKRIHGPYGEEQVTTFSYSSVGGKIVGFYGRSGTYLDAIGVHCEPPRARSCLDLFQPTSCCDTNVCCQFNWSVFCCFWGDQCDLYEKLLIMKHWYCFISFIVCKDLVWTISALFMKGNLLFIHIWRKQSNLILLSYWVSVTSVQKWKMFMKT